MANLDRIREEAVEFIMRKYEDEPGHTRQVTRLALIIFDQTLNSLHSYGHSERCFLKYAGLLHDIGYHISPDKHNKHSYQLIIQSQMAGFTPEELEIVANIARYHRGSLPNKKHPNFADIKSKDSREMIRKLSAFLRLADGLDRSHSDVIKDIKVIIEADIAKSTFILYSRITNCVLEIQGALKKKDLFEEVFNLHADFQVKQA